MGYFDILDNVSLNKYKKNLKIKKNYRYAILRLDWWSFKFHAISLSFDSLSKTVKLKSLEQQQQPLSFDSLSTTVKLG
jgi:hypothetical protein